MIKKQLQSYKKTTTRGIARLSILHIWQKMCNFAHIMASNGNPSDKMLRLTLRMTRGNWSASVGDPQSRGSIVYEPYELNNGISPAANLREAFLQSELLKSGYRRVLVLTDAPVLLIPEEEYVAEECATLFQYTFATESSEEVVCRRLSSLGCVSAFAVNKDLLMVLKDHFEDIRIAPLCEPVWTHLYKRNFVGPRHKLFAYFFGKQVCVFSFAQGRFKFCNTFDAPNDQDALYYLLYVWRQLGMNAEKDELHLVGEVDDNGGLCTQLRQYVRRVVAIPPQADFRNIAMAKRPDIPYDLKAAYLDEDGWRSTTLNGSSEAAEGCEQ